MRYSKCVFLFALLLFLFGFNSLAAAEDPIDGLENKLSEDISLEGIEKYWNGLVDEYGGFLPDSEKMTVYDLIKNKDKLSLKNILRGLVEYFFHELILNGKLLGMLFMLTLFSIFLQTLHNAFDKGSVSKIAYFVVYIVLLFLALNSFYTVVTYTKDAIDSMGGFMIALLPLLLGLMASFGNLISISFFHPITIFLINASGMLVSHFILPLLFISALLLIVSSLNDQYKVTHLANLFKNVGLGVLGAFLTIFLGVMSVQGTASAIQDGVGMKTAKFITGNFIPVIGRAFTDAADTVLSASLVLKNAVGIVGVVLVLIIALFPAIKILAIAAIYKIAAAVLQPIGDGPVISVLNLIGKYVLYMLACLLAVSLMFFLAIVIIIVAGNLTLLLR
ncbi:stage III sporulation protein AE [Virgibacillus sp. 179-BFC.A HS]|uniref:Stage III sporulation protein AE n=1 Tax=Tigheibacillus jepli TaxID=3035914 RepID=A0ABU5CJA2_9BACI|nr:stage III sporulation protein AE [Virgibacillus sp. 179-BFC.A HS]MDY0405608.1 stage III sporulation protein AE [Virgibacillus sp. 179-BFC.A HS]